MLRVLQLSLGVLAWGGALNSSAAQAGIPQREAIPILRIPGGGQESSFTIVGAVERLPDGRTIVMETFSRVLIVFDSLGRFVQRIGRAGDGPGEFVWPQALGSAGDSVWVGDATRKRITVFSPTFQVARTISVAASGSPWLLADGRVLDVPLEALARLPVTRTRHLLSYPSIGSGAPDTLTTVETITRAMAIEVGGMQRLSQQPFDDGLLIRASRDGQGVVIIDRRTEQGRTPALIVRRVGLDGVTRFDVRLPYVPVRLPGPVIENAVARFRGIIKTRMPNIPDAELNTQIRRALYVPDHAPTVTSALAAQDGTTWLRREQDGRPMARWTVLDRAGRPAFEFRIPAEAEVLWARGAEFYASVPDADGVPDVVLYRVR